MVINPDADKQVIEHVYADEIEPLLEKYLVQFIEVAHRYTPWEIENCYFLKPIEKEEFAQLLTIQYLRTKETRKRLDESSHCLTKVLEDMGVSEAERQKYELSSERTKITHLHMLTDLDSLVQIAASFYSLTWVLLINKTKTRFYTSDSPIMTIHHVQTPVFSGTGLRSKGVEVFFPISPECGLAMFDGEFHGIKHLDRRVLVCSENDVRRYNWIEAVHAEEMIISKDDNWKTVKEILVSEPGVFKRPRTALTWGEKTYTPEN